MTQNLWVDPSDSRRLYASNITEQLLSTDGGVHWSVWEDHQEIGSLNLLAISPGFLLGGRRIESFDSYKLEQPITLTLSLDRGESWSRLETGLKGLVLYTLALDPVDPSRIYLGTSAGIFIGRYAP